MGCEINKGKTLISSSSLKESANNNKCNTKKNSSSNNRNELTSYKETQKEKSNKSINDFISKEKKAKTDENKAKKHSKLNDSSEIEEENNNIKNLLQPSPEKIIQVDETINSPMKKVFSSNFNSERENSQCYNTKLTSFALEKEKLIVYTQDGIIIGNERVFLLSLVEMQTQKGQSKEIQNESFCNI